MKKTFLGGGPENVASNAIKSDHEGRQLLPFFGVERLIVNSQGRELYIVKNQKVFTRTGETTGQRTWSRAIYSRRFLSPALSSRRLLRNQWHREARTPKPSQQA
ncbi:unnamed protein product [Ixodes pacificus]